MEKIQIKGLINIYYYVLNFQFFKSYFQKMLMHLLTLFKHKEKLKSTVFCFHKSKINLKFKLKNKKWPHK